MPFSLSSYLLGVGTVVAALALGFGGGVLLTKTAMKDTPVAETRVERVKRTDSPAAPQPVETVDKKVMPAPALPPPAEPATTAESPPQTALARPTEESTQSAEQKEREFRKAEARKIEQQKRDAERKAKTTAMARAKQRPFEEQPEPSRPEYVFERSPRRALAFEREESRFNPLDIPLFGRSREFSPIDRED